MFKILGCALKNNEWNYMIVKVIPEISKSLVFIFD